MKNRLQFNRIPALFASGVTYLSGTTMGVSGREKATEALEAFVKRRDFIPLIGEPIVVRYIDDKGKKQAMLAIGKATGSTENDTRGIEYHIIDTAKLQEDIDLANEHAAEALDLASAATHDIANHLVILKNMIGENGIFMEDGSFFDGESDDPSKVGLYKNWSGNPVPYETTYISAATNMFEADLMLDAAIKEQSVKIDVLSGVTQETIDSLNELWEASAALSAATVEFSANTVNEFEEVKSDIDELSAATGSFSAGTSSLFDSIIEGTGLNNGERGSYAGHDETHIIKDATSLDNADVLLDAAVWTLSGVVSEFSANTVATFEEFNNSLDELSAATIAIDEKVDGLSANTMAADKALDNKIDELSANTMAADQALDNKIDELSANTMAADQALEDAFNEKIGELSANTMAADQVLQDQIDELANRKVLGVSAITVETLENGDSKVSLVINEEDDKVLTQNALGLKANVSLVYSREDKKIYLKGKNDATISTINADDFIKDGMLSAASVFTATEADHEQYPELVVGKTYIKLLFNVDGEEPGRANPVFISAEDLVDVYTVDPESHTFMEINDYLIKLNVDKENGLASYNYARNISAVTANIISATGLNMGEQGGYPGHDETHYIKNAGSLDQADVLLDEAIWGNNQGLAELSATTESFSSATNTVIENILAGTGLNTQEPGEYHGHDETHYIKNATSLDNADVLLDEALWAVSGMVVGFDERIDELEEDVTAIDNRLTLLSAVTAEFSATTDAKIAELSARTVDLGEVYEYIDSGDTALKEHIDEVEEVVAGALNDLNERVGTIETHFNGEYIPLTGYELASGLSEDELIVREEDSVNDAFGKIQKQILDNEEAIAAGLNDLNRKVDKNTEAIAENTGVTVLSATVQSFSSATYDIFNRFGDTITNLNEDVHDLSAATINLSGAVMSISAKTSGVLTLNLNGVEQGKYCPSASTTINLEAIQEVTGEDVLLTGYELATGTTEEELAVVATDTVNDAFGKVQKQIYDIEAVTAGALNDLDDRITDLSGAVITLEDIVSGGGASSHDVEVLSGDVISLSAAVVNNQAKIQTLSGDVANCFDGAEYVSSAHTIIFKHGDVIKGSIDASAFTKDGMVSSVAISGTNLVISFNTDAGKEDIVLPLASIFNPDNYYNKTEINALSGVVANNVTNINNVSGSVVNNLNKINNLSGAVANNVTNISNLSGAVVNNANNISNLSGAVTNNATNISNLSGSVVNNANNISNLSGAVVNNANNISNLSGAVVNNFNKINNLSGSVVDLSGAVVSNRTDINTLSASLIDDELVIAASLNDLNRRVVALSGNVADSSNLRYTTSNALTDLNFAEFLTIATINGNATLSIASTGLPTLPANGVAERHVIIENTGSSVALVTIANDTRVKITPNNTNFNQFAIDAGGRGELNVLITYNGSAYTIYVITT